MTETSSEQLPNLTAGFAEEETKTYVESGKYLRWHEDDRLTAFFGNTRNRQYKFDGATGDNSGSFSYVPSGNLETGNALDRIYAVYPYDETTTITDDGKISLTLPAVQIYDENSFGRGANTMFAVTENLEDTFLPFKNVCGYLKLKLYNADGATIKSIEVKGNGDEKIAGAATASIAFGEVPQLTMADDATTSITLDCGDGVALGTTAETATEFWVVIPETTFEGGITITVTDAEGGAFEKSTTKEVVIERNAVQPMAALEVEYKRPSPTNNEIWYTNGSTTDATKPDNTEAFGANIISNIYDAEKKCWVIRFNGEVTTIGEYAFLGCSSLTSVIIPDSVTSIGNAAFEDCSSLTSVTIGNGVDTIGEYAFYFCENLTSVIIPDSVTEIGSSAFYRCSSLTSVTIGNGVAIIEDAAFYGCCSLTSVTIPDSVNTIGNGAFSGCSSLQEFKGNFASTDHRCLIIDGVINSFAIGCGATEYTIPASVTEVGASAFRDCGSLTSVTIPDSVTKIGTSAFNGCTSLTSVYCKAATPPSNSGVFDNNASGRKIYVPAESIEAYLTSWSVYSDAIVAYDFDNCEIVPTPATYVWYTATEKVVPSNKNDFGAIYQSSEWNSETGEGVITFYGEVTSIGASAFRDCSNLISVTIPDNVTTIGEYAFEYCGSLTNVTIPNSVTTIGEGAFKGCKGELIINSKIIETNYTSSNYPSKGWLRGAEFTSLTISDSVTSIGNWVFWGCESLTSVTIGNNVTSIGSQAFEECCSLTSVTIGDSVTSIGNAAFEDCSSLTSVTIPDNVTTIGKYAFCYCENLTSVTIPNSITKIEDFVFSCCSSLTSVTIPNSVTTIGIDAFYQCKNLTSVYCKAIIPPSLDNIGVFFDNASGRKIYVPTDAVDVYKAATYWSEYRSYIVGYDF